MSVTTEDKLAELEARAGASDAQRDAWLAERRAGITATEIRDLVMGKTRQQDLIDLKLGRKTDTFTGNAYTEWGKKREPVIAEGVRGFGIEPESRVFHGAVDSRHLASPDGIGVDFDGALILSEIKTSGWDIRVGTEHYEQTGYALQMQWCMWVTGADRCLFVFEERIDASGEFHAGQTYTAWVERDDEQIARLVAVADGFLAEMDRQREGGGPVIDEAVDTHAVNYLRGLAAEKEGKALKEASYKALLEAGVSQESPLARVTFTPGKPASEFTEEVVDLEAAMAALPKETAALERAKARVVKLQAEWDALANEHKKTVTSTTGGTKPRVTVTAGKGTKK